MWCDGEDGDHIFVRPIMPKDAICAGRVVFGIGFENLAAIRCVPFRKLMRMKAGMARVDLQFAKCCIYSFAMFL